MLRTLLPLLLFIATNATAEGWWQWGRTAQHQSASPVIGDRLTRIQAEMVLDPLALAAKSQVGGSLLVHYPVPLIDGDDLFVLEKSGFFSSLATRETQNWNVKRLRTTGGRLSPQWTFASDWKPVPSGGGGGPFWEPVYHPVLSVDALWAPGAGGTMFKVNRATGAVIERFNPFGAVVDASIFVSGPPAIDDRGNIYYNAIQLDRTSPWGENPINSWLVKIAADGTMSKVTIASLTPGAPAASEFCTTTFSSPAPWPPSPTAVAPSAVCGAQRPGINVTPAVAPDGTIYTVSRAHFRDRWGYVIAVNPDLTPKWATSMRNRLRDGCNISIPPNGTPGGCRIDAPTGVDPTDNQFGSGAVRDDSTSSPVVAPDGRILYGAYTRYNYSQGHLMMFNANGTYAGAFGAGWDVTPAIYQHGNTYSVVLKENRYNAGSYCGGSACPARNDATPNDPESYFITQLDASLNVEWRFQNTNTQSCERDDFGVVRCQNDHPWGFEWCVNAVAVDGRGVVYANAEDGNLYAIGQGGRELERIFMQTALGAAYTPLSIGPDGRIYTQNDGKLFVVGEDPKPKRRAVRR